MTISELAKLNKANGGHFFDRDTLKLNGETQKSFSIRNNGDGTVTVIRRKDGTSWKFDTKTGRINFDKSQERFIEAIAA